MAIKLKSGQTIVDNNGETRTEPDTYGIVSRMEIHFFNRWAHVHVDIFPSKAIRDLQDVKKRVAEIEVQIKGDDFETYIASCSDAGYAAVNTMTKKDLEGNDVPVIDTVVWTNDEI